MNTPNEVQNEWQERRDLVLAVRERVSDQLGKLTNALVPEAGPSTEEVQRIEDLQFDLGRLEEAFEEAERKYQAFSHGPEGTGEGHDNG